MGPEVRLIQNRAGVFKTKGKTKQKGEKFHSARVPQATTSRIYPTRQETKGVKLWWSTIPQKWPR